MCILSLIGKNVRVRVRFDKFSVSLIGKIGRVEFRFKLASVSKVRNFLCVGFQVDYGVALC